jgi:hypothetical protein
VASLPIFNNYDGGTVSCSTSQVEQSYLVCASYDQGSAVVGCGYTAAVVKDPWPITLRFDSVPPPAPVLIDVTLLDGGTALVHYSASGDATFLDFSMNPPLGACGPGVSGEDFPLRGSTGSVTLLGMHGNGPITITAQTTDDSCNYSADSNALVVTPVGNSAACPRVDCSAVGGPTLGALGLVTGAFVISRRKRTWR